MDKFKIVKFVDDNFEIDVRTDIDSETVWLTQNEMASLFDVNRSRIIRHISNIYSINSTYAKNTQVQIEGKRNNN